MSIIVHIGPAAVALPGGGWRGYTAEGTPCDRVRTTSGEALADATTPNSTTGPSAGNLPRHGPQAR